MQKNIYWLILIAFLAASCGGKKDEQGNLNDKKAELQKLKDQQRKLGAQITQMEAELAKIDTGAGKTENAKLVTLAPVQPTDFTHYVDLQGRIDATNISYVAPPNGQGGIVTALYVKQGDNVRKGQVLAKLDDQMIRQQTEPLRVQLSAAEDTYRRTKNLFDQGIGTYQNVLQAQTAVETLRRQIGILQQQAGLMIVKAPTSGVADVVNVRVGEAFVGTSLAGPQIRIVNTSSLKVIAEVPENYLGRIGMGSNLKITFPNLNRVVDAKVNVAGKTIDPNKRTFYIEAPIPSDPNFKPNQIATVQVQDYAAANSMTIPVNTLQNDDKGKFVMVGIDEKGKLVARKRYVVLGELYQDRLEIKSGLSAGDRLIVEGFQNLYEGQPLKTA